MARPGGTGLSGNFSCSALCGKELWRKCPRGPDRSAWGWGKAEVCSGGNEGPFTLCRVSIGTPKDTVPAQQTLRPLGHRSIQDSSRGTMALGVVPWVSVCSIGVPPGRGHPCQGNKGLQRSLCGNRGHSCPHPHPSPCSHHHTHPIPSPSPSHARQAVISVFVLCLSPSHSFPH